MIQGSARGWLAIRAGKAEVACQSAEHAGMCIGAPRAQAAFGCVAVVAELLALAIGPDNVQGLGEFGALYEDGAAIE
jgi:hypothetical protein